MECPVYTPLVGVHLPVFKAIAGQITYVGAIRIDASKDPESDDPPEQIGYPARLLPGVSLLVQIVGASAGLDLPRSWNS